MLPTPGSNDREGAGALGYDPHVIDHALASDAGTEVIEEVVTRTSLARPWNVIVHDDPVTLMGYVTITLQRIFGYALARAEQLMMEVHQSGRSVVWTGDREQAELYVLKLHAALLRATMEQVEA